MPSVAMEKQPPKFPFASCAKTVIRELGLPIAQARSLAAHYVRLLRGEYGGQSPREIARRVFDARRQCGGGTGQPRTLPDRPGPDLGGGASGGSGPNLSAYLP